MTEELTTDEGRLRTIRLFPDYADTVLWVREPIDYQDTELSRRLVSDLQAWEQFYYDSLDADFNWVSTTAVRAYSEEGTRLARRVADEVGPDFVIEFSSRSGNAEEVQARSDSPASNPAAEAAFTSLFNADEAEDREIAQYMRNNPGGEWIAYAPLSGTVVDPKQSRRPGASSTDD